MKQMNFLCILGFHKLRYIVRYLITSKLECLRCGKKFLEGQPGELYECDN